VKILLITQDFPPMVGGIATFLHNIADGLCQRGHQVTVLAKTTPGQQDHDEPARYSVQRYALPAHLSSLSMACQVWRHSSSRRADVILLGHVMSTLGLATLLVSRVVRAPYAVLCHGGDLGLARLSRLDAHAVQAVVARAALLLANSRHTRRVLEATGYAGAPVVVLNPGVDTQLFRPGHDSTSIRSKYGLDDERVILSVGRLVARKNYATVLEALPAVIKQMPDLRYVMVGHGPEEDSLRRRVAQLGLERYVIFAQRVATTDLPKYYCASDLLVMPSRVDGDGCEGFGIVFAEAAACGKPVVGGRSGGISDAVVDGVTGLLVDPDNIDEVAEAILKLLNDKHLAQRLGRAGRKRAVQELTWEAVASRLETVLAATAQLGSSTDVR
jgi:phosphatidylinositol alpha-1,6-mannosyltransferase